MLLQSVITAMGAPCGANVPPPPQPFPLMPMLMPLPPPVPFAPPFCLPLPVMVVPQPNLDEQPFSNFQYGYNYAIQAVNNQ